MKRFLVATILLLTLGVGGFYLYLQHYLNSTIDISKIIYIPKGSTKSFINYLKNSGYDVGLIDYYLLKRYGYPQAGWIDLKDKKMSREEFYKRVTHSKAVLQKVTLIPGETTIIALKNIATKIDLNSSKLYEIYTQSTPYKDGVLIADSYKIPKGIDEKRLIQYLLKTSLKRHKKLAKKLASEDNLTKWFEETITKASIIQKESANSKEMPIISAIIDNRIKKKMKLQMDGSLNYGEFSHKKITPKRIREDNSSYNTYKYYGLPKEPVCIVSIDAIKAALNPAKVDYLFFVLGANKKHIFSKSYKEHKSNIKKCVKK